MIEELVSLRSKGHPKFADFFTQATPVADDDCEDGEKSRTAAASVFPRFPLISRPALDQQCGAFEHQ